MTNDGINIEVTGGDQQTRAVIGSVIDSALQEIGFTNVSNGVTSLNGHSLPKAEALTILDVVKATLPDIIDTPIEIVDGGEGDGVDLDEDTDEAASFAAVAD